MKIATAVVSIVMLLMSGFGFAGGGGSDSGGDFGDLDLSWGDNWGGETASGLGVVHKIFSYVILFCMACTLALKLYLFVEKIRVDRSEIKRNKSTKQGKWICVEAERIFKQYQADWTNLNTGAIAVYSTPEYHKHASYMLELLQNLHRVNKVSQLKVHKVSPLSYINEQTELPKEVSVKFEFSGLDEVVDTRTGKVLYRQHARHIHETWNFIYDGKALRLNGISQPTESAQHLVRELADFARKNGMYYSPDWGRYALPERGLIFGGATMRVADINNHVIGKWGDMLVQLYTYAEKPSDPSAYYLVGQMNVPKDYLGVIVKSRKYKTPHKPDRSYDKFEMEWGDFNERYEVYASSRDALPAFELLNPKFMEYLYDKNLNYNLEVADNVIYIFANVRNITKKRYAELLEVLKMAHKELER